MSIESVENSFDAFSSAIFHDEILEITRNHTIDPQIALHAMSCLVNFDQKCHSIIDTYPQPTGTGTYTCYQLRSIFDGTYGENPLTSYTWQVHTAFKINEYPSVGLHEDDTDEIKAQYLFAWQDTWINYHALHNGKVPKQNVTCMIITNAENKIVWYYLHYTYVDINNTVDNPIKDYVVQTFALHTLGAIKNNVSRKRQVSYNQTRYNPENLDKYITRGINNAIGNVRVYGYMFRCKVHITWVDPQHFNNISIEHIGCFPLQEDFLNFPTILENYKSLDRLYSNVPFLPEYIYLYVWFTDNETIKCHYITVTPGDTTKCPENVQAIVNHTNELKNILQKPYNVRLPKPRQYHK